MTNPVIVPYATWRSARVGGYYDTGTEEVYGDVNEDPQVNPPAENNGGDQGGEQGGDQGGGGEGGGGKARRNERMHPEILMREHAVPAGWTSGPRRLRAEPACATGERL